MQVLAGWVGAQDRHLAKFSGLLNRAGYATVRGVMPTPAVFFPTQHPRRRWTEALLDFVDALDPGRRRPLVLWWVGGGGAPRQAGWCAGGRGCEQRRRPTRPLLVQARCPMLRRAFSNGGAFPISIMSRLARAGGRCAPGAC